MAAQGLRSCLVDTLGSMQRLGKALDNFMLQLEQEQLNEIAFEAHLGAAAASGAQTEYGGDWPPTATVIPAHEEGLFGPDKTPSQTTHNNKKRRGTSGKGSKGYNQGSMGKGKGGDQDSVFSRSTPTHTHTHTHTHTIPGKNHTKYT